jgi:hypothetical protein
LTVNTWRIPRESREWVGPIAVTVTANGAPVSDANVEFAVLPLRTHPAEADWAAPVTDPDGSGGHRCAGRPGDDVRAARHLVPRHRHTRSARARPERGWLRDPHLTTRETETPRPTATSSRAGRLSSLRQAVRGAPLVDTRAAHGGPCPCTPSCLARLGARPRSPAGPLLCGGGATVYGPLTMVETRRTGRTPHELVEVAPTLCANGHRLGPLQVLIGLDEHPSGVGRARCWTCRTCGVTAWAEPSS